MSYLVSFIIPHKGRFDMLKQTLQSIAEQDYPIDKLEIIVISQTPETKTVQLLENNELNLQVILRPEGQTISSLRNHGTTHAKGKYLAFLDADVFLSNNWVSSMISNLEEGKERVIVSAMQICGASPPPLERIRTNLSNAEIDTNVAFLPGRNLFLSRDTFDKVGGFPEHLITCEDYYFTDKAAQFGNLYYTSDATYIHLGEDKFFSEMFKKEIWRGQSNLQSIQGRHIPLREIPSFILPLWICLSLLLAIASLIFGAIPTSIILFLAGIVPLLIYSIRLYRLSKKAVTFSAVLSFYTTYFPARAIGTLAGLFKTISANHK